MHRKDKSITSRARALVLIPVALAVAAIFGLVPALFTAAPGMASGFAVSYATSGAGNTAGLAPGTNHAGALLHVESIAFGSYAAAEIQGILPGSLAPAAAPAFTASSPQGYAAGSGDPRMEIQPTGLADSLAADITVYPAAMGGKPTGACYVTANIVNGVCFFQNNTSDTWAQAAAYLNGHGGVQQAYVVQDSGSASILGAPYNVTIGSLSWAGQQLLPVAVANSLTAKSCGNYANRHWTATSAAGAGVHFTTHLRLNSGRWVRGPSETVTAEGSVAFVTHQGGEIKLGYPDGLGHWVYTLEAARTLTCT